MSDNSDPSFFAAVRAVICFIAVDGKVHQKEREWFFTLMDGYGFSRSERRALEEDFKSPPDLADLWNQMYRPEDRDRLMRWARGVSAVDGETAQSEKELLKELESLSSRVSAESLQDSYRALAHELIKRDEQIRFWDELHDLGQILNRRYRRLGGPFAYGPLFGWIYPEGPLNIKSGSRRPFFWMMIIFAVFASALFFVSTCAGK